MGVPEGVLPTENTIVSLTELLDWSAVLELDLAAEEEPTIQFLLVSSFTEGEKEKVGMLGRTASMSWGGVFWLMLELLGVEETDDRVGEW